ncbi:3-hydroxyisobutyrate dehydrogenase [Hyaloraphidium curvatum]|nr:3-hydroxyisobutyrate dehydrogenase [Hyaloraphidium curvatum]
MLRARPLLPRNATARLIESRRWKSDAALPASIGFIGLGQMGYPMATNLFTKTASSKPKFVVYDVSSASTSKFTSSFPEAKATTSLAELSRECDVIVTMLPGPVQVKEVYLGKGGLFEGARTDQLFIDSSTIDAETIKGVSEEFRSKKAAQVIDAPVSGGTGGATKGTLSFMVGSPSKETFERANTLLKLMGGKIWDCGDVGAGQIAKICNNMLLGISMIASSEALNLGVRLGMDPKRLSEIINSSSGRCWSTDTYNPVPGVMAEVPASKGYEGGFGVKLMAKDLGLAMDASRGSGSTTLLGATAFEVYKQLSSSKEFSTKDFSSVFKWLNKE